MIDRQILEALQKATTAAVTASTVNGLAVKYVGRTFTIPNDHKWLEIVHIPNKLIGNTWGSEETYRGLFRLILHWRLDDAGAYPPMNALQSIASYFYKGRIFTIEGFSVRLTEEPELTGVIEASPEMLFPVTIRYSCFKP